MIPQSIGRTGHSELHAVFAIARDYAGERIAFRVGLPADWHTAQNRWERLANRLAARRRKATHPAIRWSRRRYRIDFYEVRAVNRHGQGLGSERHATALPVPYLAVR